MLLDSIVDVNAMLEKAKAKAGANESYKFWRKVANNMKFAWDYMNSTKWIHDKNIQLTQENSFLRKYVAEIESRLNAYEVVRDLKISGKFDETIARVDAFMEDPENMRIFELKKKLANGK